MSEEFEQQVEALRRKFDSARDDAAFEDASSELSDLSAKVSSLPSDIEEIRSRGYAFRSYLENKAEVLNNNWDDVRRRAQRMIDDERDRLTSELRQLEARIDRAESGGGGGSAAMKMKFGGGSTNIEDLEGEVDELENQVSSAARRIGDVYETMAKDINSTVRQIKEINWFMDEKDEASFDFLAGESLFLLAKAEWVVTGKGRKDPDGILYLTDQRLIFEQKEKTGKTLGMFGGKMEQEVEWEVPLHQIEGVEAENKGMFGGKDMLNFTLGSGAPHPKITVEVKGGVDCKFWAKQVQRMMTGGTDDERAIEPDPELVETLRNAPTECHVCGATLPMIMAGQMQIECQYCGAIIRL